MIAIADHLRYAIAAAMKRGEVFVAWWFEDEDGNVLTDRCEDAGTTVSDDNRRKIIPDRRWAWKPMKDGHLL